MIFIDRPDGKRIHIDHALHAVMPYMMRGRNESAVYYEREIDVENALRLIRSRNSGEERFSLFSLMLAAAVRTLALRPELNRFVHGRALYQRNHIAISFIVKQKMTENAPEGNAKVFFEPGDDLETVNRKVNEAIEYVRSMGEGGDGERIAKFAHAIPGGKALLIGIYRLLDRLNLAPWALLKTDPLYATAYFANLGSIGIEAPFHHLYEWGNASLFVVIGKLRQKDGAQGTAGSRRHVLNLRITLDERVSEGLLFARAASVYTRLVSRPELLELSLEETRRTLMADEGSR